MKTFACALDFGTSKIVTLVGEGDGLRPATLLGVGTVAYDGYMDGHWNAPDEKIDEAIKASIQQAEKEAGRKISEVYVGVPGEFIRVERNEVLMNLETIRKITPADVDRLMSMALEYKVNEHSSVIHRSPAWFAVDDQRTMEPVGLDGSQLRCMASFVVADNTFIEDIQARIGYMGIRVLGFLSPALGEALMLVPPEERDKTAVLIDCGYLNTELMVVEGDALIYHTVIPLGGGDITADICYALQCNMYVAEQVKRKYAFGLSSAKEEIVVKDDMGKEVRYTYEQVSSTMENRLEEIASQIDKAVKLSDVRVSTRSSFYLTGGTLTQIRGGKEFLSNYLGKTIRVPQPVFNKIENTYAYTSSLGLLEIVYESLSGEEGKAQGQNILSKAGTFLKAFFTK